MAVHMVCVCPLTRALILGTTTSEESCNYDLDLLIRNIGELNKLVAENIRTVEYGGNHVKHISGVDSEV